MIINTKYVYRLLIRSDPINQLSIQLSCGVSSLTFLDFKPLTQLPCPLWYFLPFLSLEIGFF